MTTNKVVNLFLGLLVQVLELVHSRKLGDIETVWQDAVGLSLEQMLALIRCDMGDSRKDIARVGSCALDAVSVVDTPLSGLCVDIKPLQVIVEVDRSGAKIPPEQSCVSCEDSCNVNATLLGEGKSNASKPLVEVGNYSFFLFMADILA